MIRGASKGSFSSFLSGAKVQPFCEIHNFEDELMLFDVAFAQICHLIYFFVIGYAQKY